MKKSLTILLGVYVCLLISYFAHQDKRNTTSSNITKSKVNKVTPGQSNTQDSVEIKNEKGDSGELVSRKVVGTDVNAGDIYVANE